MKKKCALVLALVVVLCALVSVGLADRYRYSIYKGSDDDGESCQVLRAVSDASDRSAAVRLFVPKENKYTGKPISASVVDVAHGYRNTWSQLYAVDGRICKPPTNDDIMYEYPDGKDYPTPPTEPGKYKAKITACDPEFPDFFRATLVEEFEILEPEKSKSKQNTIRELLQLLQRNKKN